MKSGLGIMSAVALSVMATVAHAQGTGDVIRIGILNDQSGPYADVGGKGSVIAAKLAVEEFGGKLLGKRIEVIAADHQNKPDIASAIARQWIDTESVDVIADGAGSSAGLAIQQVTRDSAGSSSSALRPRRTSPAKPARPPDSTSLTTPMLWPTEPPRLWSSKAVTPGSSSPLITRSVMRSSAIPARSWSPAAARSSAR